MEERIAEIEMEIREVADGLNDIARCVREFGEEILEDRRDDLDELAERWVSLEEEAEEVEEETGHHFFFGDALDADAWNLI